MEVNEFTKISSKWLNIFIKDLADNPEKVLAKVEEFQGNKDLVKKGIQEGPESLPKTKVAAKEMFNFISFYATGSIQQIEVRDKNER